MELNELIAESIVNRLSDLLKTKIFVADIRGDVLASTDLSETGKNYIQLCEAVEQNKEIETSGPATKLNLPQGLIVPISYSNESVGALFMEDKPEKYEHYRKIIATTTELLIQQSQVTNNLPYKAKMKDNFLYALLHRNISVEDPKVREEADLFDLNLTRDKVVLIVSVGGFWKGVFGAQPTASEDEKQTVLSNYKKKLFQSFSKFFGRLSECSVAYFGSDVFVVVLDELYSVDGREMVQQIRTKADALHQLIAEEFKETKFSQLSLAVGTFYRGRDGAVLSYEEAWRALNLGLSIGEPKHLYHIDDLGMIATLASGNKKWQDNFVQRHLMKLSAEEYLLETLEVFFDRNMSLTQTSKQISIHRNTLLYRLDKIKKITGLDPRKFNNAIELKLALILNKVLYLERPAVRQA